MEGVTEAETCEAPLETPPFEEPSKLPRKPTRHHRGHDSFYDEDGNLHGRGVEFVKGDEDDSDDDEDIATEYRNSKWYIVSAAIFVVSSILYVALGSMVMDYYWFYKEVPRHVTYADDDATWWNYFVNCTDDGFIPENVTMADDDYTWMAWYNESFFEDDVIWTPKARGSATANELNYVSKYMVVYFFAALGFLFTGAIEIVLARKARFFYRMLYYIMMIAAAFGVVSAILTHRNPLWSNITNCISCNLWALEGVVIAYQRVQRVSEYEDYTRIYGIPVTYWFYVADFSFLIGTVGDAISSFFYIFEFDSWVMGISAVVFASFWLLCAIVYLIVAIHDYNEYKKYFQLVGLAATKNLRLAVVDEGACDPPPVEEGASANPSGEERSSPPAGQEQPSNPPSSVPSAQ